MVVGIMTVILFHVTLHKLFAVNACKGFVIHGIELAAGIFVRSEKELFVVHIFLSKVNKELML